MTESFWKSEAPLETAQRAERYSDAEIIKLYANAKDKKEQIRILAQLNLCSTEMIKSILGIQTGKGVRKRRRSDKTEASFDSSKKYLAFISGALYEDYGFTLEIIDAIEASGCSLRRTGASAPVDYGGILKITAGFDGDDPDRARRFADGASFIGKLGIPQVERLLLQKYLYHMRTAEIASGSYLSRQQASALIRKGLAKLDSLAYAKSPHYNLYGNDDVNNGNSITCL